MKNTPLAKSLFGKCKTRINKILLLIDEYEEMRDVLDSMGYRIPDGDDELPLPSLEIVGCVDGWECVDSADVLDEYLEHGPIPPAPPATVKRVSAHKSRERLGKDSDWTCRYGRQKGTEDIGPDSRAWHVDHSYPFSRGGDNQDDNLVLSCATCNLLKHAQSALEYQSRIQ